ncbi:MAG: hypothetical protein R2715_03530 [Ilumatobacteraceae bacterium]
MDQLTLRDQLERLRSFLPEADYRFINSYVNGPIERPFTTAERKRKERIATRSRELLDTMECEE